MHRVTLGAVVGNFCEENRGSLRGSELQDRLVALRAEAGGRLRREVLSLNNIVSAGSSSRKIKHFYNLASADGVLCTCVDRPRL
jgi:hypothetical protein